MSLRPLPVDDTKIRDLAIDSVRGIALLLMVAGHVIGSSSSSGMNVDNSSYWRFFYLGLEDIRMPLFSALSGYVYALRPVRVPKTLPKLIRGKVRRLLVPLITVGTVFYLTQALIPGTNQQSSLSEVWRVYVYGVGHFWFVQAVFLIFVIIGVADAFNIMGSIRRWGFVLSISLVLYIIVDIPAIYNIFSMNGFAALLPFFLAGYGLSKFDLFAKSKRIVVILGILLLIFLGLRIAVILDGVSSEGSLMGLLSLCVGLLCVTFLILCRHKLAIVPLAWIGKYSFTVYLLHVFGSAGSRIVLAKAGLESDVVLFIISMVVAVGLPIAFERTLGRVEWVSWAFLGQRPRGQRANGISVK
ncbi:acyltransferase [Arthrobacter sp. zg-ZUI100]|uniref:acyltransferase family protein n=1 Tax=Arthrobacter jiangjiafuii TaxID=2817475 RepID=UPI001AEDB7E4|nr:acyltransferase [Arthrobacter jiangjiafuii]MBP3037155.1 acyltransferase [Arthrobacter jiangjiafuii]